jgi:hypothetical protein
MKNKPESASSLKVIYDSIATLLGVATAGVAFLAAVRNDPKSYLVSILLLAIVGTLIFSIRLILPENKVRYARTRWLGFSGLGLVLGVLFSFLAFAPNRDYVQAAFVNSPTPTQTATATATPSPSPSPSATSVVDLPTVTPSLTPSATATSSPTPTASPTLSPTPTSTASPTPELILSENFLDNSYGWAESDPLERPGEPAVYARVIGGSYKYKINCPSDAARACTVLIAIPNVSIRDFQLDFDATITGVTNYANVSYGALLRFNPNSYYAANLYKNGFYELQIIKQGRQDSLAPYAYNLHINKDLNAANHIRIRAQGSSLSLAANGLELASAEDGNIDQAGRIYFTVSLPPNSATSIELDNVALSRLP